MSNDATALSVTLVDEWVRGGLRHAVVSPGSRSTPLALALAAHPEVAVAVVLDERVAGFMALGLGRASGRAAVVLTTSGTATTHLHAAVVEADQSEIPLLVCTADRPPELYGVGAAQTIDQRNLYGGSVRAYLDQGVPDHGNRSAWRSLAARALLETAGERPGPVQLNLPYREPLVGPAGELPAGRADGAPWHRPVRAAIDRRLGADEAAALARRWVGRRGVLVAGAGVDDPAAVVRLADALGWPVLAEPRSGCRWAAGPVVAHADAFLRHDPTAASLRPEVIVSLGAPAASKVLARWLASAAAGPSPAEWVAINRSGAWWDPDRLLAATYPISPSAFVSSLEAHVAVMDDDGVADDWLTGWRQADDAAAAALATALAEPAGDDDPRPSEPAVAAAVWATTSRRGVACLVASSSMPVRDLEWYAPALPEGSHQPIVVANRGANGIDGVVATAVGSALHHHPGAVWLLIGDLAFLHDTNALLELPSRPVQLRIVIVDNGGGGIFSFLPQASAVPPARFEQLFGTPQHVDLARLLDVYGIAAECVTAAVELDAALDRLAACTAPVAAVIVDTGDRAGNARLHARLDAAVAAALTPTAG